MRTIASTLVVNAKVVRMNNNSLTIELVSGERVFIHRRVFNTLQENPDTPTFITEREYMGVKNSWIAIPKTV